MQKMVVKGINPRENNENFLETNTRWTIHVERIKKWRHSARKDQKPRRSTCNVNEKKFISSETGNGREWVNTWRSNLQWVQL